MMKASRGDAVVVTVAAPTSVATSVAALIEDTRLVFAKAVIAAFGYLVASSMT